MKRLLTLGAALVCVFTVACGSGDSGTAKDTPAADTGKADTGDHGSMAAKTTDSMAAGGETHAEMLPTGSEITLTGNMGCGHCNFQIGNSCAAAMKTADGNIVIFDGVSHESEMFQNRMDGAEVTVAGVVSYDETGVAHMALKDTPM